MLPGAVLSPERGSISAPLESRSKTLKDTGGMLALRPLHELKVQDVIAPGEDPGQGDTGLKRKRLKPLVSLLETLTEW
jgi:hypothetical protein